MKVLRQNTATVIPLGPFIDSTDGFTLEEALTIASIDIQVIQPLDTAVVPANKVDNGTFATDTIWVKGAGWSIAAGVATAVTASTDLEETPAIALVEGVAYELVYTTTRTAGSVQAKIGGTAGTSRSTAATFTEIIIAGVGTLIEFTGTGFSGTIDNVTLTQVPMPIVPAASGSINDMVLTRANTGTYYLEIAASQVRVLGVHRLTAWISGVLIVQEDFVVRSAIVYDAFDGPTPTLLTSRDIGQIFESSVASLTSDVLFVVAKNINFNDIHIGQTILISDTSSGTDDWVTYVTDVVAGTNTIAVHADPQANGVVMPFTLAIGDLVRIETRMHPMYVARNTAVSPYLASQGVTDFASIELAVKEYFQLLVRNDAAINTDLAARIAIANTDEGSGAGTFDPRDDALQAVDANLATAQSDLDTITGADGATLATLQGLYAPAKVGAAMDLGANVIDAAALDTTAVDEIVLATWAKTLGATGLSASALMQIIGGVSAAKLSGAATTTITIRDLQDAANMIVATVDIDGNRSAITLTTPTD